MSQRTYTLIDAEGRPYRSTSPGTLGGYRRRRLYGRLDCPSALRAITRGGYQNHRVFFADEETAIAAGYRPCAVCLPERYTQWIAEKASPRKESRDVSRDTQGCGTHRDAGAIDHLTS